MNGNRPESPAGFSDATPQVEQVDRYRRIFNATYQSIGLLAPDGTLLEANTSALRFGGVSADEVLGRPFWLAPWWAEDARESMRDAVARAANGEFVRYETTARGAEASTIVDFSLRPLRNESGAVVAIVAEGRDIGERKAVEAQLRESEMRFRGAFDHAAIGMALVAPDGRLLDVNHSFCQMLGYSHAELVAIDFQSVTHPHDLEDDVRQVERMIAGEIRNYHLEKRYLRKDGEVVWAYLSVSAVRNDDGSVRYFVSQIQDITARKQAERARRETELRFQNVVASLQEGVVVQAADGEVLTCNPAAARILGLEPPTDGSSVKLQWHGVREDGTPFAADEHPTTVALRSGKPQTDVVIGVDRPDGARVWLQLTARPILEDEAGDGASHGAGNGATLEATAAAGSSPGKSPGKSVGAVVTSFTDITTLKEKEQELTHQAYHDPLTKLPNRRRFFDALERILADPERPNYVTDAVMYLDLDRFKLINDGYGHEAGDALLAEAARRLRSSLRPGDMVARLGGDEFALLLLNVKNIRNVVRVAQKILAAFRPPFDFGGNSLELHTSIGITLHDRTGISANELVRRADTALRRAKRSGRGHYVIFDDNLDSQIKRVLGLERDIQSALAGKQLRIHYQPIVDLMTGEPYGAEALLRWHHPERGLVSPAEFIPIAEDNGLILPIGDWVLAKALVQLKTWHANFEQLRLGINLSPRQLESNVFLDKFATILKASGVPEDRVVVELTETYVMQEFDSSIDKLKRLADLGVSIAIDDFGTGYSSLSYLQHLPISHIKIDRAFLKSLPDEEKNRSLVEAIFLLARKLGLEVIAEGIERPTQESFLQQLGCRFGQGFLYQRPVPGDSFGKFLKERHAATAGKRG